MNTYVCVYNHNYSLMVVLHEYDMKCYGYPCFERVINRWSNLTSITTIPDAAPTNVKTRSAHRGYRRVVSSRHGFMTLPDVCDVRTTFERLNDRQPRGIWCRQKKKKPGSKMKKEKKKILGQTVIVVGKPHFTRVLVLHTHHTHALGSTWNIQGGSRIYVKCLRFCIRFQQESLWHVNLRIPTYMCFHGNRINVRVIKINVNTYL